MPTLVLRLRAPDRPGIVARIGSLIAGQGGDIRDAQVYGDDETGGFFVRMVIATATSRNDLAAALAPLADEMTLDWSLHDSSEKLRVLIAVSKFGHCLVDLIHKAEIGQLPIDIVGVVSNHETMRKTVEWHGLPYHHLPTGDGKAAQEAAFLDLIAASGAELTVLARYMQILSDDFSTRMLGRCINIHHSFLPSFKGAKPYHQAHLRGVKLIGATAHYVTPELDEGPIIEQDVRRVSHAVTAPEMVAIGREVEASVLSRAVLWHAEQRVFLNATKTVVLV
jgi:formyltetrahydrofolate deformylase